MAKLKPIRRVYGKPWSKMSGIAVTQEVLQEVGEVIAKSIANEARKDWAKKRKTPRGVAMGLPNTPRFFDSFSAEVVGRSTILIRSSWPWVERHQEGRERFKMWWLTQQHGVYKVPIVREDGSIAIVATPPTVGEAWIHPGVLKYNFVPRGVRKGRQEAARVLAKHAIKQVLDGNLLK